MRIGNMSTSDVSAKVQGPVSLYALKKAKDENKEEALTLLNSVPLPQPIHVKNRIDIRV